MCKYVKHRKQREQKMDRSLVCAVEGYSWENPSFLIDTFTFAYLESGMQPLNSALVRLGLSFSPSPGGFFNRVSKHTPYLLFTVFSSGYFSPGQLCWYWNLVTGSSSITNAYKDTTSCLRPEVYFTDRWSRNTYFRWAPNFFNFIRHLQYDHGDILKLFSKKVEVKNENQELERLCLSYLHIPVLKCLFYWK